MLRTQFKMELLVYSQDRTYSSSLSNRKREEDGEEEKQKGTTCMDNHATLQELMLHLKSYYKVSFNLEGGFMNKTNDRFRQRLCFSITVLVSQTFLPFVFLQIASQHLAYQIPLVIRYQLLQESAVQLQREMLQVLQDKEKFRFFLREDSDIVSKREALQSRLKRLMQAREYLMEF